jgi:alpha-L-arabinofuranosidase
VVVSTSDHSRRLRRVIHRSMKGHSTKVTSHSTRYSAFDPDRWWQSRRGIRTEVVELQKLLLDVVRHPIS